MVTESIIGWVGSGVLIAQQQTENVMERLDPPRRAAVVMALLGIVLTGLLLVLIVMLGAHWVRRMARYKPGRDRTSAGGAEVGKNRALRESLKSIGSEAKSNETVLFNPSSKETRVDS